MTRLFFRRAVISDLADIVAMLADAELGGLREDSTSPVNPKYAHAFEAIDNDPNQLLVVVEYKTDPIGRLQLSFVPGLSRLGMWRGQIESVRVARGCRGKGIEREMLEWATTECRERGCGSMQLTSDKSRTEARRFYESLGFTASHEGLKYALDSERDDKQAAFSRPGNTR